MPAVAQIYQLNWIPSIEKAYQRSLALQSHGSRFDTNVRAWSTSSATNGGLAAAACRVTPSLHTDSFTLMHFYPLAFLLFSHHLQASIISG